jgi:hypothetical protein
MALAVAGIVVMAASAKVRCAPGSDCGYTINGSGIGYNYNQCSFGDPTCAAEITAKNKANDNVVEQCSQAGCASHCPYQSTTGFTLSNRQEGTDSGGPYARVEPNPNGDGTSIITVNLWGVCTCYGNDGFDNPPFSVGGRVPLTTSQKILQFVRDPWGTLFGKPRQGRN